MKNNNAVLNITSDPEELTFNGSVIYYENFNDGFRIPFEEVKLKHDKFELFIDEVETKLLKFKKYDYSISKNEIYKKYMNEKVRIFISGNQLHIILNIYCINEIIAEIVWNAYLKFTDEKENTIDIYMNTYFIQQNNVNHSMKELKYDDLGFISEKYYPYIDTKLMFDQFFTGSENILLCVGESGLGKCLHGDEEIEIYVDDETYDKLIK